MKHFRQRNSNSDQRIPYPFERKTERLLIRSANIAAAEQLHGAVEESIESLGKWMSWADHVPGPDEIEKNCADAEKAFRKGTDYRFHLFLKDREVFVGSCELHRIDWSVPKCEIGFWVRKSQSGKGYITEAVQNIVRWAFDELEMNRVEIRMSAINIRSRRVPERLGFELEGILKNEDRHPDGTLRDTCVYARIRES
jgi:RimJ/RimL family protein N-acetyltransferase